MAGAPDESLSLDEQDIALLPPSMRWLAKTAGLSAVLALVRVHGGGAPVYVPATLRADHYLVRLVGLEAFAALVAEYGGTALEIARCERAARELVYRQIRREAREGVTQNTLALRHGFTVRHIRTILESQEEDRNGSLF